MVHLLDDLGGFSARAQAFLRRTARRETSARIGLPTDFMQVRDSSGRPILAPFELVIRREGFAEKFGGLRYDVRRSVILDKTRHDMMRRWDFDLAANAWSDRCGWYFDWIGEHVSSPVRFLIHTDGRMGVSDGGPFLEVASSVTHLIESHAVMDAVSQWDPWSSSLEPWAPSRFGIDLASRIDGLSLIREASGPFDEWWVSESVAIRNFRTWTSHRPRTRGTMVWTNGDQGRQASRAARAETR
ncbi:hypothetical protein Pth03_82270 [Planotetraspora thailandica]|uniref:Uncharacterized protein n=1 Tax=Planotetraspora thailandica TaxID=487172 RepID=A0A8J3Y2Q3_9ACTN|nr:hypothetical protein Pth03_82270 [Planotetraspora thailandica]